MLHLSYVQCYFYHVNMCMLHLSCEPVHNITFIIWNCLQRKCHHVNIYNVTIYHMNTTITLLTSQFCTKYQLHLFTLKKIPHTKIPTELWKGCYLQRNYIKSSIALLSFSRWHWCVHSNGACNHCCCCPPEIVRWQVFNENIIWFQQLGNASDVEWWYQREDHLFCKKDDKNKELYTWEACSKI